MKNRQITFNQAETASKDIALSSIGFATARSLAKEYGVSVELASRMLADTLAVAEKAAYLGLRSGGSLDDALLRESLQLDRRVADIRQREMSWKKAHAQ